MYHGWTTGTSRSWRKLERRSSLAQPWMARACIPRPPPLISHFLPVPFYLPESAHESREQCWRAASEHWVSSCPLPSTPHTLEYAHIRLNPQVWQAHIQDREGGDDSCVGSYHCINRVSCHPICRKSYTRVKLDRWYPSHDLPQHIPLGTTHARVRLDHWYPPAWHPPV